MFTNYGFIDTPKKLDDLIIWCLESGIVSVDFETNAKPVYDDDFYPTILGVSFQPGYTWIIPLAHKDSPFRESWKRVFNKFCEAIITNPAIIKVAWNLHFEYSIFMKYGYRMRGRMFDAMLAKYLLDETRPNDLKAMVDRFLPQFSGYDLQGVPSPKANPETKVKFWSNVPLETLSKYCGGDCDFTLRLMIHFEERLLDVGMYHLLRNLYMPLIRIISRTYLEGVMVDKSWLEYLDTKYENLIKALEDRLRKIPEVDQFNEDQIESRVEAYIQGLEDEIDSGNLTQAQVRAREEKISRVEVGEPQTKKEIELFQEINFGSPKQLGELFYLSEGGFRFPILDKTESGAPSTGEDTLIKLKEYDESGFIDLLLELRGLSKLHTTYIKNILEDHIDSKGFIHPSYLPHATVTGRFGSRNPNFQNIPRTSTNADIKTYIIAPKDYYFVEIDGSQMELRVAAEIYQDRVMIDIFNKGQNIHVATSAKVFGVDYDIINKARKDPHHPEHDISVVRHKTGKVLNFTIFYGAEGRKVAEFVTERTGIFTTKEQGDELIEAWFKAFPDAAKGIEKTRKLATQQGFIQSPLGRKRRLPILLNKNNKFLRRGEWNEALRQAVNSPIQGFASDLTQWANIQIYREQLKGNLPDYLRLVSTVHDSLEFYVHKADIHTVVPRVTEIAAKAYGLHKYMGYKFKHVTQKFSAELGITWGHAEEYHKDTDYILKYDQDIINWESSKLTLTNA